MRTPLGRGKKDVSYIRRNARRRALHKLKNARHSKIVVPRCFHLQQIFRLVPFNNLKRAVLPDAKDKGSKTHIQPRDVFVSCTKDASGVRRVTDDRFEDPRLSIGFLLSLRRNRPKDKGGETLDLFEFLLCTMSGKGVWKTAINASPMEAWPDRDSLLDDWKVFELTKQYGGIVQYRNWSLSM